MDKTELIRYLDSHAENGVPSSIDQMSLDDLNSIKELVDSVLERERAGLDSLFNSMTHTMKFIPNILLQTLTEKYIEPSIAARISVRLTVKQASAIANGLSEEYVARTSHYMPAQFAAELLSTMKVDRAKQALSCAMDIHPKDADNIIAELSDKQRKKLLRN